ncbi:MAG: proline racemase [Planctomycetota bacterium]|jgi:proline racemase
MKHLTLLARTIDAHTAGEPFRIVVEGGPALRGNTILEKRRDAQQNHDNLRRRLMFEPRGHADMYGCFLTEAVTADGHIGVLFTHNEGYSTMCGHGIIALTKIGIESELFGYDKLETGRCEVRIDSPAGRITAWADRDAEGRFGDVSFRNVPSFVLSSRATVEVAGLGQVTGDLAYGGAFYFYVDATSLGMTLDAQHARELIDVGMRIKRAVMQQLPIEHPTGDADLNFLYGVIFVDTATDYGTEVHSRNVCIFADGEVDRSPTGTGVSGRIAIHHARGEVALGQALTIQSLLGTFFRVEACELVTIGGVSGVTPLVTGRAHRTGEHRFELEQGDPLEAGFFIR